MAPPEGYQVNLDNPPRNLMTTNFVVYGIGLTLSALFLAQKLFVKIHIHRGLGLEDCRLKRSPIISGLIDFQGLSLSHG